jgi:hypothetical protein
MADKIGLYRVRVKVIVDATVFLKATSKEEAKLKFYLMKHPEENIEKQNFDNWLVTDILTEEEFQNQEEWRNRK